MKNKGFTLIELIVVMAIIAILVLLAAPRFLGYTKNANVTAMNQDIKVLADAAEMYHIDSGEWPVSTEIKNHGIGGLDELYAIDASKLGSSVKNIKGSYNDYGMIVAGKYAGQVFHLEGVEDKGGELTYGSYERFEIKPYYSKREDWLAGIENSEHNYVWADESDFVEVNGGYPEIWSGEVIPITYYQYTGSDEYIIIPEEINGVPLTNYAYMFDKSSVKGVASYNPRVKNMFAMFRNIETDTLDLEFFYTDGVELMGLMFREAKISELDISHFNTSSVVNTWDMFRLAEIDTIDLRGLDFTKSNYMRSMFHGSQGSTLMLKGMRVDKPENMISLFRDTPNISTLDLTGFNMKPNVMAPYMFVDTGATIAYVSNENNKDIFNKTIGKPDSLTFSLKQ